MAISMHNKEQSGDSEDADGNSEQQFNLSDLEATSSNSEKISSPTNSNSFSSDASDKQIKLSSDEDTFEGLLKLCGEAGKWQFMVFMLASFVGFCTALHNLIYAFIGAIPEHWCSIPEVDGYAYNETKASIIPKDDDGEFEKCRRYHFNVTDSGLNVDKSKFVDCQTNDFDSDTFTNTIVTEYNLVCGYTYLASTVQAMYMFGILFGSPIFGAMSDQWGRKKTILLCTIIFTIAGPAVALAPNFYVVMISRFILAASSPGIYGTSFVLVIEILGPEWRGLAGNLFCLPFALGYMFLPGVAYFIREWRYLQLALSAPSVILLLTWWFLPESPRWLIRKGRIDEAEKLLRKAASMNGRKKLLPSNFAKKIANVAALEKEEPSSSRWIRNVFKGYLELVKFPKLRTRTLVIYFCWASTSMIYYGIALNSPNLSADRYLYTFIGGILEVPSYFLVPPLIKYFGRRPVFTGSLLICSCSLLISLFFETGSAIVIVLALFGKLVIGGTYALVYLYATEIFPTLLRTYGLGTSSMVGRIGSITAPFVVDLLGQENKTYPSIVFGSAALIAGLLGLLLPETRNRRLPETVEDVEFDKI